MAAKEIVDLKTIAQRTGYSVKTLQNNWPRLLQGVKPMKLGAGSRRILFYWEDVVKLLESDK